MLNWRKNKKTGKELLLSPGEKFGNYIVERLLGCGSMGTVYLIRHAVLETYHALKILSSTLVSKDVNVERFIQEAKFACRLKHTNLIEVHDAGYSEKLRCYYIVMDYVPGGSIRDLLLDNKRISLANALKIVRQIADALQVAYENDIVHRDIKPDNIMFTADGDAKLADLGIAKSTGSADMTLTMDLSTFGTPAYMSPEQARDSRRVDTRADIYSLGVVFYEMLAGERPYVGSSAIEILSQVVDKEELPDIRKHCPNLPDDVVNLIRDMTAKDRDLRISTPQDLVIRLSQIEVNERPQILPIKVSPTNPPRVPTPTPVIAQRKHHRKILRTWLCLAIVGLMAGVAYWWYFGHSTKDASRTKQLSPTASEQNAPPAQQEEAGTQLPKTNSVPKTIVSSTSVKTKNITSEIVAPEHLFTYEIKNGEATILGLKTSSFSGALNIPSTLGGVPVTEIGGRSFSECKRITSITIPEGVMSIGSHTFSGCSNLVSVKIPKSVVFIAPWSFLYCDSLQEFVVDPNNKVYASREGVLFDKNLSTLIRFPGGKGSSYVTPSTVEKIGEYAFITCSSLSAITLTPHLKTISNNAFLNCKNLTSIVFSEGLNVISGWAFQNTPLTSITLPASLNFIGVAAFNSCENLTEVRFKGLPPERVGRQAIPQTKGYYPKSQKVKWEEVIDSSGKWNNLTMEMYDDAPSQSSVNSSVPESFFKYEIKNDEAIITGFKKTYLGGLKIPSMLGGCPVTQIAKMAFRDCNIISVEIPESVTTLKEMSFFRCLKLKSVVIPFSLKKIPSDAFVVCNKLELLSLHKELKIVCRGGPLFVLCSNLRFSVADENPYVSTDQDGMILFNKNKSTVIGAPGATGDVVLPDSVETLARFAFSSCDKLESIALPKKLKTIEFHAIRCPNLRTLTIPKNVKTIGNEAIVLASNDKEKESKIIFEGPPPASVGKNAFSKAKGLYPKSQKAAWEAVIDSSGKWNDLTMEMYDDNSSHES